jgi:glucose-1-phosphate cytidylyltransferase
MQDGAKPPVVILCGGRGTRLQEHSRSIPKPLVEIGGRPIVWHVIRIYAAQGFRSFLLATGHMHEQIAEWAAGEEWPPGVSVECVDTGAETPTGGRVSRLRDRLDAGTFCVTYADGVADVDLDGALGFHADHGALGTVTVVRPRLQFGVADLDGDDKVHGFVEKPRSDHWINGGFMVFEPGAFSYLSESSVLEREPLERLAADGQLRAFRHTGFWECMDTYKDALELNDLWAADNPPWKVWAE